MTTFENASAFAGPQIEDVTSMSTVLSAGFRAGESTVVEWQDEHGPGTLAWAEGNPKVTVHTELSR